MKTLLKKARDKFNFPPWSKAIVRPLIEISVMSPEKQLALLQELPLVSVEKLLYSQRCMNPSGKYNGNEARYIWEGVSQVWIGHPVREAETRRALFLSHRG